MSSKLASLLVQEGLVNGAKMAEAFTRQVIYGGALDTIVLEMGLVDESALLDVLQRAVGLPALDDLPTADMTPLARVLPQALAAKHRIAPFAEQGTLLKVVTLDSFDRAAIDRLSSELRFTLVPHVAPEVRLELALERVYGTPLPARFAALWSRMKPRHEEVVAARRARAEKRHDATMSDELAQVFAAVAPTPTRTPPSTPVVIVKKDDDSAPRMVPREGTIPTPRPEAVPSALPHEKTLPSGAAVPIDVPVASPGERTQRVQLDAADAAPRPSEPESSSDATIETRTEERPPSLGELSLAQFAALARPDADDVAPDELDLPVAPVAALRATSGVIAKAASFVEPAPAAPSAPSAPIAELPPVRDTIAQRVSDAPEEELPASASSPMPVAPAPELPSVIVALDAPVLSLTPTSVPALSGALTGEWQKVADILEESFSIDPSPRVVDATLPYEAGGRASQALDLSTGLEALEAALDRDAIFEVLCRVARVHFDFVALFAVHGDRAACRVALDEEWVDRHALARVTVSFAKDSAVRQVVQGRSALVGQLGSDPVTSATLRALGRPSPVWGALFPLVLRSRTVAVLYADASGRRVDALTLGDITQALSESGRALQRVILRQKQQASSLSANSDIGAQAASRVRAATMRGLGEAVEGGTHQAADATTPIAALTGEAFDGVDGFVAVACGTGPGAEAALEALLSAGDAGAEAVARRLPGPLALRRFAFAAPTAALSAYGPLLGLVGRFGRALVPHLVKRLTESSPEARFYTALAFSELPFPDAVATLGARLFDEDAAVRRAAALSLGRFGPSPELRGLIESLRRELPGRDEKRQRAAVDALGELRDATSAPRLVELLANSRDELLQISVRRALVTITKQDFGNSRWRWRGWWDENRNNSRIDWLLDGLKHAEPAVRQSASDELEAITSERFGYHLGLPRPAREEARQKWLAWYRTHAAEDNRRES